MTTIDGFANCGDFAPVGRPLGDLCKCGHALGMHSIYEGCAPCIGLAEMRAAIAELRDTKPPS